MDKWNPDAYLKYENERTVPSRDLAAHIQIPDVRRVIDIGCGPGNSTRVLREKWPNARIAGLDSSREMIEKARKTCPESEWILADAETWKTDDQFDVVFSNAALQWMAAPTAVITNLFGHLNEGGALAVQVPLIGDSPLHRALIAVSERPEWRGRLQGAGLLRNHNDETFYYNHLSTLTSRMELWITTYLHIMDSHRDIIDWYSSTGMRTYLERIDTDDEKRRFTHQVLEECKGKYPIQRDGKVMFPFRRLFFVAWKGSA